MICLQIYRARIQTIAILIPDYMHIKPGYQQEQCSPHGVGIFYLFIIYFYLFIYFYFLFFVYSFYFILFYFIYLFIYFFFWGGGV